MVKRWAILWVCMLWLTASAQEVLLPLECAPPTRNHPGKAAPQATTLPFFDDFSTGQLSPQRWQTVGGATVTTDVSPLAPTIGVATLDALSAEGTLHPAASTNLFPADTLASIPIRLDSLTPTDSVVFSFHYMPGGGYGPLWERIGDAPDDEDSLFLDFYRASDSAWITVWSRGGTCVDTLMSTTGSAWQYVVVPLTANQWFDSLFQFRFRSYASLEKTPKTGKSGNCDFWHIDYVMLDRGRDTIATPTVRDIAFAAPAISLLKDYRAMPYRQYSTADMATTLQNHIVNLYNAPLASHYTYFVTDTLGNVLHTHDGGFENAPAFLPGGHYQEAAAHATPTVDFTFPTLTRPTTFHVVHTVSEGTAGDAYPQNDTVRFIQVFSDYYAYDDGTPENGYGITSTASRLYLAYSFELNTSDTLTAVDIFFNSTLDEANKAVPFYLTVWNESGGKPGTVLYRDDTRRYPQTGRYARYVLEQPLVVDGHVYVGFEQSGNNFINIGFDRSHNTAERIYYLTGTEWQQSILSGSLMLRPCFGAAATVGIATADAQPLRPTLAPNPANDIVRIEGVPDATLLQLYDMQGRLVATGTGHQLATAALPPALYLLRAITPQGTCATLKVIIQH